MGGLDGRSTRSGAGTEGTRALYDNLLTRFRSIIAGASEADIRRDVTLGGRLTLAKEGALEVNYAPFEHVVFTAKVVIVGITPGAQQAANALCEVRRLTLAGAGDEAALEAAKVHASFSGAMRDGLVRMLDHVGLNGRLGIATCASLWGEHAHMAHFTSALRYPVLLDGGNYNGKPSMTGTPVLRRYLAGCLAQEARALPDALWIPCGGTAAKGVGWLVEQGVLDLGCVCIGLTHPSPANAERVRFFVGVGRDRAALSTRTNAAMIDRARDAMIAAVAGAAPPSPPVTTPKVPAAPGAAVDAPMPRTPGPATRQKAELRRPSRLGLDIQAAVAASPRFERHQPDRLYQCTYRTRSGRTVFAFERCTANAIRLWLPATAEVAAAAAEQNVFVPQVLRPYPDPADRGRYGRLSTLAQVPELAAAPLLAIGVSTVLQAMAVLDTLP